jgi:hypothetical protein
MNITTKMSNENVKYMRAIPYLRYTRSLFYNFQIYGFLNRF